VLPDERRKARIGRHESGVRGQDVLVVNAQGERRGTFRAKAWERTTAVTRARAWARASKDEREHEHREGEHDVSAEKRARNVAIL
jgi:hypothetical protein